MSTITTESGDPPAMLSHSLSWLNLCRSDMGSVVSLASSGYLSVSWVVVEGRGKGGGGGGGREWREVRGGKGGSGEGRERGSEGVERGGKGEGREGGKRTGGG